MFSSILIMQNLGMLEMVHLFIDSLKVILVGVVAHVYNPSSWETEAEKWEV